MYKTFEEAKEAATKAIEKHNYIAACVVTETKLNKNARKSTFGFRFNDSDTNGQFVKMADGTYCKATLI
jgi:hypothetical protein